MVSPEIIGTVLDRIAADSGLKRRCPLRREICRVLFADFDSRWLGKNQKFDVSFSSPGMGHWRFSVSDYGEKERFAGKLRCIFALLGKDYRADVLRAILAATSPNRRLHQTTFGIDWSSEDKLPRLKVYFEELRHRYSPAVRARMLGRICAAAGLRQPRARPDLAAICVDFLSGCRVMLKTYSYEDWNTATRVGGASQDFLKTLGREKRAFFYRTLRYDSAGRLASQKLYKVYEVQQIGNYAASLLEIYEAIRRWGAHEDVATIERYRILTNKQGALWYPVLCALDEGVAGMCKLDAYYSFR